MKNITIILSIILTVHVVTIRSMHHYNSYASTDSPLDAMNILLRELRREVGDIRNELRSRIEVIKYELSCEIKELKDALVPGKETTPAIEQQPPEESELESYKKMVKRGIRKIVEVGEDVKNNLRHQKAELFALRNSVYDSKEEIISKSSQIVKSFKNSNESLSCHMIDIRKKLMKVNGNLAVIMQKQDRMIDAVQSRAHVRDFMPIPPKGSFLRAPLSSTTTTTQSTTSTTSFVPPTVEQMENAKVLPGCTINPLETQETLETFGKIHLNMSTGRVETQEMEGSGAKGPMTVDSLFPNMPENCNEEDKKTFLEYPPMPRDCKDAFELGFMETGLYRVQPPGLAPREVYCDHDSEGGGWTVFVARKKSSRQIPFNRSFHEYEVGFGEPDNEHWLGLEALHALTRGRPHLMRADLEDWEGNKAWAKYSYFSVSSQEDNYRLRVSGYTGTAGDSMRHSHLQMFSTIDQDNDQEEEGNCALGRGGGGWWWGRCACTQPTGIYRKGRHRGPENGVTWWHWKDSNYSLKTVLLKIKAVD